MAPTLTSPPPARRRTPTPQRVLLVAVAAIALSLGANLATPVDAQQTADVVCVDDRLFFDNDEDAPRIRADLAEFHQQTLALPFAEPPGRYEVLVSTFEIFSREGQEREQVNVIVNGQTFGPTPDLPGETDGVLEELNDISLGFVTVTEPIEEVTVRHAFAGEPGVGPESIRLRSVTLVCTPEIDPNLPTDSLEGDDSSDSGDLETTDLDGDDSATGTDGQTGDETNSDPADSSTAVGTEEPPQDSATSGTGSGSGTDNQESSTSETVEGAGLTPTTVAGNPTPTTPDTVPVTVTDVGTETPTTPTTPTTIAANASPTTAPPDETSETATTTIELNSVTSTTVAAPARPETPTTVEANQSLPETGSGSGVLTLTSLLLVAFGAFTMVASRRLAPRESKLSKQYLESLDKVFAAKSD